MAIFLNTLLHQGKFDEKQIWSTTIHGLLTTPAPSMGTHAGLKVGYGTGVYSRIRRCLVWHGHGGDADGYRSRYAFLPGYDAAYAVVINTDNPGALVRMERLIEAELSKAVAKPIVTPLVTTPANPDFNGTYYPATVRFSQDAWAACESPRTWLRAEKDQLFVRIGDRRHTFTSTGNNQFTRKGEHHATMALVKDQQGVLWFVGELGNFVRIGTRHPNQQSPVPPFLPRCLPE